MARTLTVISADNDRDAFEAVVKALNAQFEDRSLIGDLDGMDASFEVCLNDAVSSLGGHWDMRRTGTSDEYFVALDGAPLSSIVPQAVL